MSAALAAIVLVSCGAEAQAPRVSTVGSTTPEFIRSSSLRASEAITVERDELLRALASRSRSAGSGPARVRLTAPRPAPRPDARPLPAAPSDVRAAVCAAFGPECERALRVAWCESTWRTDAVSRGGHRGLFQLSRIHQARAARLGFTWDQMLELGPNVAVALDIFVEQGWRPWSCQP